MISRLNEFKKDEGRAQFVPKLQTLDEENEDIFQTMEEVAKLARNAAFLKPNTFPSRVNWVRSYFDQLYWRIHRLMASKTLA